MRLILLLALTLTACVKKHGPDEWRGIPDKDRGKLTCGWDRNYAVGSCVGAGHAYTCIHVLIGDDDETVHDRFDCARVSAPVPLEEKSEGDNQ